MFRIEISVILLSKRDYLNLYDLASKKQIEAAMAGPCMQLRFRPGVDNKRAGFIFIKNTLVKHLFSSFHVFYGTKERRDVKWVLHCLKCN